MEVQDVLVAESASLSRFEAYYTALEDEAREDADSDEHEVSELYERKEDHACECSPIGPILFEPNAPRITSSS